MVVTRSAKYKHSNDDINSQKNTIVLEQKIVELEAMVESLQNRVHHLDRTESCSDRTLMHRCAGDGTLFMDEHVSKHNFYVEKNADFGYNGIGGATFDLLTEGSTIHVKDSYVVASSSPYTTFLFRGVEQSIFDNDDNQVSAIGAKMISCEPIPDGEYCVQMNATHKKQCYMWTIHNTLSQFDVLRHGVHKDGKNDGHLRWVVSKQGVFAFTYAFWHDKGQKSGFRNRFIDRDTLEYCIPRHFHDLVKSNLHQVHIVYFMYKYQQEKPICVKMKGTIRIVNQKINLVLTKTR